MTAHTPTPWHRNIKPAIRYPIVFSGRNTHVVQVVHKGLSEEEVEANLDFLIRAVNAHDALVAALNSIAEGCSFPEDDVQRACRDRARAALRLASPTAEGGERGH